MQSKCHFTIRKDKHMDRNAAFVNSKQNRAYCKVNCYTTHFEIGFMQVLGTNPLQNYIFDVFLI